MPARTGVTISKSRYLSGLQCLKRAWTEQNARGLLPPTDPAAQAMFDQGHEVGRLATELFPGGIEISRKTRRWSDVIGATQKVLDQRRPLYEAGFRHNDAACRVDILVPVGDTSWDLLEVKSSTRVKDVHLADLAFQAYVLEGAGIDVRNYYLVHIDSSYVRKGSLVPRDLFHQAEVTDQIKERVDEVADNLVAIRQGLLSSTRPEIPIGPYCDKPYACPLKSECWAFLPERSVFDLYGGGTKGFRYLEKGILDLDEIPIEEGLSRKQTIQLESIRTDDAYVDADALRGFLDRLVYPIHYFDIETYSSAIPPFDQARPYQQIPFLFSIHRVEEAGAVPRHFAYMVSEEGDPRAEFLRAARVSLGDRGSIVAYNAPFEQRVLAEGAVAFPEFQQWAESVSERFVDLLAPFRAFHYYDPNQGGSVSLKSVLPALTGMRYDELEISEGGTASREYMRVTEPGVDPIERARVLRHLESYCGLDTHGLVAIVDELTARI